MRRLPAFLFSLSCAFLLSNVTARSETISNCGFPLEVPHSQPQRIVTIKSSTTELLLALGLGDHVIGKAFQDGPPAEKWAAAYDNIDVLADRLPSREAVLALEPDFIFAGWESNLAADALGDRETLQKLGVSSYVPPAACRSADVPEALSFEDVFKDIEEAGHIFGASEQAKALVAQQAQALEALSPAGEGRSVLWYSSGTDTPYVGAGSGAPQMIMSALGLDNIAGDIEGSWTSLSWEAIADADPDFLILVDAVWNRAENKIARLEDLPFLAKMKAVQNKHFLIVPFAATEAGVRNLEAVTDMNAQIMALDRADADAIAQ